MNDAKDVTREIAAEIFKVDPDKATPEQRRVARKVNFSALFGGKLPPAVKPEQRR